MNGFYLSGIVVWRGPKTGGYRAPWPCLIKTDGGPRDRPELLVPMELFGDVEVGQRVELSGYLDGREWNGRRYLKPAIRDRRIEWPDQGPPPEPPPGPPPPWPEPPQTGEGEEEEEERVPF